MTPTLPEILRGNFTGLMAPSAPETAGDFSVVRVAAIALLNLLAAQEAAQSELAILAENREIARLLAAANQAGYPIDIPAPEAGAEGEAAGPAARDARNAVLRRALITLHSAVESRGDRALDRRILALYRSMAAGRRLDLPPLPAVAGTPDR
jgi:hypothetical protein